MSAKKLKLICSVALVTGLVTGSAYAQSGSIVARGDAIVTGFSGTAPLSEENPISVIDVNGPSAQILPLNTLTGSPVGALSSVQAKRVIAAREVGQVFAIAVDKGTDGGAPNIYLGATSLFGLKIVEQSGTERIETGEPGAKFMDGQFGPNGSAGSIWKVDGNTGEISEFARLPGNSAAGVGDVVFDSQSQQFFATDLDNGMIYRISKDGSVVDSFDHGVSGRPTLGLAAVNDDGSKVDVTTPAFDSQDTQTWGYTQSERRVWGLAISNDRLYYATVSSPQVWSIGISAEGRFVDDPQLEFDVKDLSGDGPITDMLFDATGRLYLAQRGKLKASFNFAEFAESGQSGVRRYVRSTAEDRKWEPDHNSYAIGMLPDHKSANGGIALRADKSGNCGGTLWSTGERLVSSDGSSETPADVHGLQGNNVELTRPQNVPPTASYFVDYDGYFGDPQNAGHVGDIEIVQPCKKPVEEVEEVELQYPPGYFPPGEIPPTEWPPEFPPPEKPYNTNLKITKKASPKECSPMFGGWSCEFQIRVRNMGPDTYFGDILIKDVVPAAPAGAFFGVGPVPPWSCWTTGPSALRCWRPNVLFNPGQYVELKVNVWLPRTYDRCSLRNIAEIEWAPGGSQWNTDPTDDRDGATAQVPLKKCKPVHRPRGSKVHQPEGSVVHKPIGSYIHKPRGSRVHRPKGSRVHRPKGSYVHKPRGSRVHRPKGSRVHLPRGSRVHRPKGSRVHLPRGSRVHRSKNSRVHRSRNSRVHKLRGSRIKRLPRSHNELR